MQIFDGLRPSQVKADEHWMSVSDLMAGLMVVFLFIAVFYIKAITQPLTNYEETREEIYQALLREFHDDLAKWNAVLKRDTLSVVFNAPEVLFLQGSIDLRPLFQDILRDFFPRYLKVLEPFQSKIAEIRIEGHTSSEWHQAATPDEAYFGNLELSQGRTRSVLRFCLPLPAGAPYRAWAQPLITANGLSSSDLILGHDGQEEVALSRRVEFRVRDNSEERLDLMLGATR